MIYLNISSNVRYVLLTLMCSLSFVKEGKHWNYSKTILNFYWKWSGWHDILKYKYTQECILFYVSLIVQCLCVKEKREG